MISTRKLYLMTFASPMIKTFSLALSRPQTCKFTNGILTAALFTSSTLGQENWRAGMKKINPQISDTFAIDDTLVKAAGIQKVSGTHIDLYTDVRDEEKINELVSVFDQAVSQWCTYFELSMVSAKSWKMRAFLIADRANPCLLYTSPSPRD